MVETPTVLGGVEGKQMNYDFGFINPMAVPHRALRPEYDIFGASKRPGHGGLDLYSPRGTAIVAAANGRVRYAGMGSKDAGWLVEVLHEAKIGWFLTRSMHMQSRPIVVTGQNVNAGDIVGYVGATGNANSPHNHFEIRYATDSGANKWKMYGSQWGTRHDPALFGILDQPGEAPRLASISIDRPVIRRKASLTKKVQVTQELQYLLGLRGFLDMTPGRNIDPVSGQFDGLFGPSTEQGVISYQASKSLVADGIVGGTTWHVLLDY